MSIDRLIKCLKMTTSDQDGEALAAIRMASKIMKEMNLTWDSLIKPVPKPTPPPAPPATQAYNQASGFASAGLGGVYSNFGQGGGPFSQQSQWNAAQQAAAQNRAYYAQQPNSSRHQEASAQKPKPDIDVSVNERDNPKRKPFWSRSTAGTP